MSKHRDIMNNLKGVTLNEDIEGVSKAEAYQMMQKANNAANYLANFQREMKFLGAEAEGVESVELSELFDEYKDSQAKLKTLTDKLNALMNTLG